MGSQGDAAGSSLAVPSSGCCLAQAVLPGRKGERRTESREIKHSLSLFLTGIILYYSAICLVTATASAVQKSYKQPYGTSE